MSDLLLELSKNPFARKIVSSALPLPLPQNLLRIDGTRPERFLEGKHVIVAGSGKVADAIGRTLARAGAQTLLDTPDLAKAYASADSNGSSTKVAPGPEQAGPSVAALVLDATTLSSPSDLKQLYAFFHDNSRRLTRNGRVVIVGAEPAEGGSAAEIAARTALEGFTRSLAKELGGKGSTANLIYVSAGAENRVTSALRFFLSNASAFVSAQPIRVTTTAAWDANLAESDWVKPLSGKIALVTGAARGIGQATSEVLAAEGAHVVGLDRPEDEAALNAAVGALQGTPLLADVSDPTAPGKIASELKRLHGGVDIVVHNAGVTRDKTLGRMSESQWDQVLNINLAALINITDALVTDNALHDGGRIISLSSIAGIAGNVGQTNYATSKAGVIGLTRALSKQLAPRGITVNAVAPGFIETRMTAAIPLVIREAGRRLSALSQGGQPQDVARAISFLAEPGSGGLTGNVLRVCGGALIGA